MDWLDDSNIRHWSAKKPVSCWCSKKLTVVVVSGCTYAHMYSICIARKIVDMIVLHVVFSRLKSSWPSSFRSGYTLNLVWYAVVWSCVKGWDGVGEKDSAENTSSATFSEPDFALIFSTNKKNVQKDAPKEIPSPTIPFWGWDRPILSREGSGFWGCMVFLFQSSLVISLSVDVNSSHP